jgi:predicted ATPase
MMLEELQLKLFKGFREFSMPCRQFTCLVGLNNCGKTSVLQAISLLHDILRFAIYGNSQVAVNTNPPQWEANPEQALNRLNFADPDAIWLFKKTSEPCRIVAKFTENVEVHLDVKGRYRYGLDILTNGTSIKNRTEDPASIDVLRKLTSIRPVFVPPVGPISPLEQFIPHVAMQQQLDQGRETDTWRSRLFWYCNDGQRKKFQEVVELVNRYVPEPMVHEPQLTHDNPPRIRIDFEEDGTLFDISCSGGGLRTLLNLAVILHFAESECYLFDEPESHLHGTLQRAIARMLFDWASENSRQLLIATHGADFIAELPSSSLIWIDRQASQAKACTEVGRVLADLGALSKADAIRAYGANKILFLEGSPDRTVLEAFFRMSGDPNPFTDSEVVVASLPDGKGNSTYLPLFCQLLRECLGLQVRVACILDNDYELSQTNTTDSEGPAAITRLRRKEIENYLIEPTVIYEGIKQLAKQRHQRTGREVVTPTLDAIMAKLEEILGESKLMKLVKFQVLPRYRETLPRDKDPAKKERAGDEWFDQRWIDRDWRIRNCPGKQVLANLRDWAQKTFQVTLTTRALVNSLKECPKDVTEIMATVRQHFYQ